MKVNFTQANLSAFKIGSQLFFFDIQKVVANINKTDGTSEIKWRIGLPDFQHEWLEDVCYSQFGTTVLKDIALKNSVASGHFYIQKNHQFEVFAGEIETEVMLDLSKTNNAYCVPLTDELAQSIKSSLNIDNLPKDFTVYDLDVVTQDIFNVVQKELLKNPSAQPFKMNLDTECQNLNAFCLDGNFLYSSNYAVCAELYQNGRDVNVKFSFGNFINDFFKINESDKYCFGEISLPNVRIKAESSYSVSVEQFEFNTLMTDRVSNEYAFLGAFNSDLFDCYQILVDEKDNIQRLKSVIGEQYKDEYFVIDLNNVIKDVLDVIQKHAVEPF